MKTTLNKMKMIVITLVCVIFGVLFFINGSGEVKAETSVTLNTTDTETEYAYAVFSTTEELNYVQTVIGKSAPEVSGTEQYLFAGWYSNKACTDTVKKYDVSITTYYAKYIPEEVLNVKAQVSTIAGKNDENEETRNIRFVSSVDNLSYNKVGFKLECNEQTLYNNSKTVFKRIDSATEGDEYTYSPKVVDTDSEYFITAVYPDVADFNTGFYVRAYIKTLDGVVVYGPSRYVRVSDGLKGSESLINMPVKDMEGVITGDSVNVTYNGNTVSASVLQPESKDDDDSYAHILIDLNDVKKDTLKSVTTFSVSGIEVKYRNLFTTHVNTASETTPLYDTSWYEAYKDDTSVDSYVVATSADLYGLALVVNGTEDITADNFEGKTVYVVSDIVANKLYVDKDNVTYSVKMNAEGQSIEDGTDYKWTRVGDTSAHKFEGKFDGQMHEISGVCFLTQTENNGIPLGFFSYTGSNAVIKNFKLVNSIFQFGKRRQTGSIVGLASGSTIDTVYSDAVVVANQVSSGGLVGEGNGVTMTNCWFNGKVQNTYNSTSYNMNAGGLIGYVSNSTTIQNSLNSGQIVATSDTHTTPGVGGLVGLVTKGKTLKIDNCLNVGTLSMNVAATAGYGAIVGAANDTAATYGTATFTTTYAASDYCDVAVNATTDASVEMLTVAKIAGTNALSQNTKNLFTYVTDETTYANESYWAIVPGGTPVLADFAEVAGIEDYQPIDTSWYNANESEYVLKDEADFYGFTMLSRLEAVDGFANKTVKLAEDITLNTGDANTWSATVAPDYQWLCIGPNGTPFMGTFDGQGHKISGVYLKANAQIQGLFGHVQTTGFIKDFSLINSYLYSPSDKLGGIVGTGYGNFDSIYCDAKVELKKTSAGYYLGGFIGLIDGATTNNFTMDNCWFAGEVVASGTTTRLGGLVGGTRYVKVTIDNSLNSGTISSEANSELYQGGLVGFRNSGSVTLTNCLNTGELVFSAGDGTTTPTTFGLVIGENECTTTNTYTINQTGVDYKYDAANADYTLDATTLYGTAAMDQLSGFFTFDSLDDVMYWAVTDYTPVLASFAEYATDAEGNAIAAITFDTSWYDASKDNYTLYDASDLYGFAMLSKLADVNGFAGKTIKLGADIVVNEDWEASATAPTYTWLGIGDSYYVESTNDAGSTVRTYTELPFQGNFDGNGHSISGIYMNNSDGYNKHIGFFRLVHGEVSINNFSLLNSYVYSAGEFVGGIAGESSADMDSVYTNVDVTGTRQAVGGFVGRVTSGADVRITDCWFDGTATNPDNKNNAAYGRYLGGFIGYNQGKTTVINHSLNTGIISAPNYRKDTSPYVGGFVGHSTDNISFYNCLNIGQVTVKDGLEIYGAILGSGSGWVSFDNVYALDTSCDGGLHAATAENVDRENDLAFKTSEELTGGAAIDSVKALFIPTNNSDGVYEVHWATVPGSTPVLANFVKYASEGAFVPDTTWYNANESSYTLNDVADYYGFALLSKVSAIDGFAGKKVTLGADIIMPNDGKAADWATTAPEYKWIGIGEYINDENMIPFKGEFDGGNNTISGIYYKNTETQYGGLFRLVDAGASVKNFSLTNSYFTSNRTFLGSIAGQSSGGSLDTIYSDAIVVGSRQGIGGLLGRAGGSETVSISNCWFTGPVTNNGDGTTGSRNRNTGGFVGEVTGNTTIVNCLNSGAVSAPNYASTESSTDSSVRPYIGGFVGFLYNGATLDISYSLNTGKVTYNDAATLGYGAIVGRADTGVTIKVLGGTYAMTSSCATLVSKHNNATLNEEAANLVHIVDSTIEGDAAKATALFEEANDGVWVTVENATPVLACFEDKIDNSGSTEATESALHTAIETAKANSTYITSTPSAAISLTDVNGSVSRRQGGWTDGNYYYQAFLQKYVEEDNSQNGVIIVKYDLATNQEVSRSEAELSLYHANDITYNDKLGLLVVSHGTDGYNMVSFVNPTTFELVETKKIGCAIFCIDYNSKYDCYIVQTGTNDGITGHNCYILNGNLEIIAEYKEESKLYCDPKQNKSGAAQGASCDDNYIYYLYSSGLTNSYKHVITVFDWNGNYVTEIAFTLSFKEPESITAIGDTIYVNVVDSSELYKLEFTTN